MLSYVGLQNSIVKIMIFNYFYKMGILAIIYKCYMYLETFTKRDLQTEVESMWHFDVILGFFFF
jgi:hypothetical protein